MQSHQPIDFSRATVAFALATFVFAASLPLIAAAWFLVTHLLTPPISTIDSF